MKGIGVVMSERVTNLEYSKGKSFQELCRKAGVVPTPRQASKFRNGKGAVFEILWNGRVELRKEQKCYREDK